MFKKIFPLLRDIAIVIGGNIIYACGVAFFILPGGLITGGTTGIALFIQHLFGVPISTFVLCFNAVMFFLGLLVLGRKFAATTILSTFVYPIALEMIQRLSNGFVITTDPVLCTVFGGLLSKRRYPPRPRPGQPNGCGSGTGTQPDQLSGFRICFSFLQSVEREMPSSCAVSVLLHPMR